MYIQIKILRERLVDVGWKNTNQGKGGSKWKLMALFPKYVYILSLLSSVYTYLPKSKLNLPVFCLIFIRLRQLRRIGNALPTFSW